MDRLGERVVLCGGDDEGKTGTVIDVGPGDCLQVRLDQPTCGMLCYVLLCEPSECCTV